MAARSGSISSECAGMSGDRCQGGGMETPELPGPLLSEGKVETGSVPNARCPRPGSSADMSKCSSTHSPPPAQLPDAPDSSGLEEHEPRSVLESGVTATGRSHWSEGEDGGPGPKDSRGVVGVPCAQSCHCLVPLESPLSGAAPRLRGVPSGSAGAAWAPSLWNWGHRVSIGCGGPAGVKGSLLPECTWVCGRKARGSCSLAPGSGCSDGTPCSFLKHSGGSGIKG